MLIFMAASLAGGCGNTLASGAAPGSRDTLPTTVVDEPTGPETTDDDADPGSDTDDEPVSPSENRPPQAVALAPATPRSGDFVPLDGSGSSDPDGDPLTFAWTQMAGGEAIELIDADAAIAGFVAPDVAGDTPLAFSLSVSDGASESRAVVTVVVLAALDDTGPDLAVDAGPDQQVAPGDVVTLTGIAGGAADDILTFLWIQTSGPGVTLGDPFSPVVSFTAPDVDEPQELEFVLTVTAGGDSAADSVTVTVRPADDSSPAPDDDPPPPPPADDCPADPDKTAPGQCGCNTADTDTDGDGTADCNDGCPSDPAAVDPSDCAGPGNGSAESDWDLYMLRLVNRARQDPAGEPARLGSAVTDPSAPVPPLAYDRSIGAAATNHNSWMHDNLGNIATVNAPDSFGHYETVDGTASGAPATATPGYTGAGPGERLTTAGFTWDRAGENILTAWSTNDLPFNQARVDQNHKGWWDSAGHRTNLLSANYTVFGHHAESRTFTPPLGNIIPPSDNIHFATQDFGRPAGATKTHVFGLLYNDMDSSWDWTPRDDIHLLREGVGGVEVEVFVAGTNTLVTSDTTMDNGAFSVRVGNGTYDVVFTGGSLPGGSYTIEDVTLSGANLDAGDHDISAVP